MIIKVCNTDGIFLPIYWESPTKWHYTHTVYPMTSGQFEDAIAFFKSTNLKYEISLF
jgi:hypothetical protein